MHCPDSVVPVERQAERMRPFLFQVVGQSDAYPLAACYQYVQVFVEGLWCAETAGVDCTEPKVAEGTVSDIHTRRKYRPADKIVLIHTHPGEQAPVNILPFVLQICSYNMHVLLRLVVVTQ